ncbi:site-specific DNA-methyltransferase [Gordonia sp. WA4-43]|uniref:site-specific DNA-methyltransferase n=1 Tax=Gordonia sp. WA4-43 TaxID=2878678 RepID=UPI001CF97F8B|nr:site-specific DNA-methyltransferase [Gordonia sp. WA4-43]UCZ90697.1 site-specific DNA-methyltransferase [Gordonia sp. WA4-43]
MARKTSKGPTPIDSIKHGETRKNIPTADAQDFVTPEIEAVRKVRYQRDETLDPQLVWLGKYPAAPNEAGDDSDLVTDAPPIYIQEKVDPRVLVENLRRTTARPEDEPELALFDTFDGLDELEQVDFYQHDANWSNRMILGDSLQVMASLAEREHLRGKAQMVYVDPPYGIKFGSNWQVSARDRTVRDGKMEDSAREAEQIKAFRDTWELGVHSYLTYLRDRLLAARDLLTESGSCFVQIGDENVHLVRSLMDEVFGPENFVSQIAFATTSGAGSFAGGTNVLANVLNYVVVFAKNLEAVKYRQLFKTKALGGDSVSLYTSVVLEDGSTRPLTKEEKSGGNLPPGARAFGIDNLTSQTTRVGQTTVFPVTVSGKTVTPAKGGWKTNRVGMERLVAANRVYAGSGKNLGYIRYIDDFPAAPLSNSWTDTFGQGQFGGDKVYVVQTATKVIERCVLMATDPGDLVIDPTCGSGTTAYVAEQWGRRWITVDTSRVALALARQRLMSSLFPWYLLADTPEGHKKEQSLTANFVPRNQFGGDIRQGFVYERVAHVMLKSIANNPDIKAGMSRSEIDAAIKRHAEFELLYDRPFEDARKVRVAGPFTVESLSPHRALSFGDAPESLSEKDAGRKADGPNFEQSILENLAKAGIQNGKRAEKLKFETFETYAGQYIQAIGRQISNGEHAAPSRIGVAIGPQYGTVSAKYVKDAAREAIRDGDVDLLCVLGFAFDPQVTNVTEEDGYTIEPSDEGFAQIEGARNVGRLPVLMVRMNADLLMGEELKKTGSGNLFTVFGEPDIDLRSTDEGYIVDLKGVDVYDPTTGEVRSSDTGQIALWMIDTDYNEESFFVRHCYFTGGNDPYKRLKTALKADIDADAWESLYKTVSRPFAKPSTGKIAVKVINDYGDEVMKVFEV